MLPFPKPDSFLADTASVAGDIQLLQDKGSLFQITVFHVGDEYGSRILGFGQILVQMLCIDPFGNAAEHASGLYTSGRISVRTFDGNDAAVFRIFGWEITAEADQIFGLTAFISRLTLGNLCRSGFS